MSVLLRLLARYRRATILTTTLVLSFLLMTLQVRHETAVVSFTRQVLLFTVSPFIKLTAVTVQGVTGIWRDYVDLRGLQEENKGLQRETATQKRRIDQLEEQALETQRLQALLAMRQASRAEFLTARVIGKDATNWFKTILLDRGSLEGVRRNQPVLAPDGLVGRVVEVTPTSAKVQLLTDPVNAVGGLIQRTRVTGIVSGNLGAGARVRYLPLMADVVVGDQVVTSGMGGVFPKGIPIGRITAVDRRSGALFQEASLQSAVDLSRLEEVLILMTLEANASSGAGTTFGAGASREAGTSLGAGAGFEAGTGRRP
ncbi:MAG: rod shape-determining protein MreC [candidate division NC10 bacterium RIFCSPLOWO2_12_FULL_66_18]|nr:MAG: rod shape-determining protein MreC [candidate division NC10 bacterium RIFCSPLOWO2_12_FULL_66_18]